MSDYCCHEDFWPETRTDPACGECRLGREEYEDECEGCPIRHGADEAATDEYSWRSGA